MPDPQLTPGQQPPKHDFWRDLDREVYQATEAAKPLLMTQRPDGRKLDLHLPLKIPAKITGRTGTAYSWSEVINAGASWTVLTGGRTGSLNAYELNGSTTVPTNAIVELRYSSAGDWRFEKMGIGAGGGTPGPCDEGDEQIVSVSVTAECDPDAVDGALVTVLNGATVLGTCTIDIATANPCTVTVNVTPGTVLDIEVTLSPFTMATGTVTTPACGGSAGTSITLWEPDDDLPDDLTLTDPDANEITLSRTGSTPGTSPYRTWEGEFTYTRSCNPIFGSGTATIRVVYTYTACVMSAIAYDAVTGTELGRTITSGGASSKQLVPFLFEYDCGNLTGDGLGNPDALFGSYQANNGLSRTCFVVLFTKPCDFYVGL